MNPTCYPHLFQNSSAFLQVSSESAQNFWGSEAKNPFKLCCELSNSLYLNSESAKALWNTVGAVSALGGDKWTHRSYHWSFVQSYHRLAQPQPASPSGQQAPWHPQGQEGGPLTNRSRGSASACLQGWAPQSRGEGRSCMRQQTSIMLPLTVAWTLLKPPTDPTAHLSTK